MTLAFLLSEGNSIDLDVNELGKILWLSMYCYIQGLEKHTEGSSPPVSTRHLGIHPSHSGHKEQRQRTEGSADEGYSTTLEAAPILNGDLPKEAASIDPRDHLQKTRVRALFGLFLFLWKIWLHLDCLHPQ